MRAAFFFLAALQTVPPDLYRAAKIDRAGPVARFRHVTLLEIPGADHYTAVPADWWDRAFTALDT